MLLTINGDELHHLENRCFQLKSIIKIEKITPITYVKQKIIPKSERKKVYPWRLRHSQLFIGFDVCTDNQNSTSYMVKTTYVLIVHFKTK